MFSYRKMNPRERETGVYYTEPPQELPIKEPGKRFHFRWVSRSAEMDELVDGYEHRRELATIETTNNFYWSMDSAVLIGADLWKLISIPAISDDKQGAYAAAKRSRQTLTINLVKVDNPLGLRVNNYD